MDFYFDFGSPYGYLASTQIEAIGARYGEPVNWRPIMLGAAMARTGGRPLKDVPMRGAYAARDLPRFADLIGVPFRFPPKLPVVALAAARAFYWRQDQDAGAAVDLAKALFHAHFGEGRDIEKPEQVAAEAAHLGIDRDAILAGVTSPEVKARLRAETEASLDRGVFGSPFIIVDGEPFWGADRLQQVEMWLARRAR